MNVLLIAAEYPPERCGGIGVFYQDLARHIAQAGCRVTVAAPSAGPADDTSEGSLTVRRWRGSLAASSAAGMLLRRMKFTRFAREVARDVGPDLIETHDWSGPLTGAPGRPLVVRLHGAHTVLRAQMKRRASTPIRLFERRLLESANAVVGVSSWIARRTAGVFGATQPFGVIPNGVDTRRFRPQPIPRSGEELLFVGAIKPEKGVFELFAVLPLILSRRPGLIVRMVGPEADGVRERLLASIPAAHAARVRFDGGVERDQLPAVYAAATVCVLPSLVEAFGLTMAEAMSCGVPVVGSCLGAGPELARNGREALLVDPRDPQALADAALRCLEDPALRERLSSAARRRALDEFSWDVVAERNRSFYSEAIEGARQWPKSA